MIQKSHANIQHCWQGGQISVVFKWNWEPNLLSSIPIVMIYSDSKAPETENELLSYIISLISLQSSVTQKTFDRMASLILFNFWAHSILLGVIRQVTQANFGLIYTEPSAVRNLMRHGAFLRLHLCRTIKNSKVDVSLREHHADDYAVFWPVWSWFAKELSIHQRRVLVGIVLFGLLSACIRWCLHHKQLA